MIDAHSVRTLTQLFPLEDDRMTDPQQQPATGDLWKWVDRLTRDRRHRLVRKPLSGKPTVESVTIPCLWTQMEEALASSNAGGGRGKSSTGSRSPLDLAIEALMTEIEQTVINTLRSFGHAVRLRTEDAPTTPRTLPVPLLADAAGRPLFDPDQSGQLVERAARAHADAHDRRSAARPLHDTTSDLRQLAAVIVTNGDQQLVDHWVGRYRGWVSQAAAALTADDESVDVRGVRGHACPTCRALWVTSVRDRETFRDPALVISFRDGQVLHITCRACEAGWWRGEDVDQLTRQIALSTAVRGPAHLWGETVPKTGRTSA